MTHSLIIEQQPNGVVVLMINRPAARNALDLDTMQALSETVDALATDTALRAVVLAGAGTDAFCSGGDLAQLSQHGSEEDGARMSALMGDALLALERLPVPVIAAVNGYALGGGSEVAVACDVRIADEKVQMGFVQVKMALTPGWGAGQRLLRLVGYARAMDLLVSGPILGGADLLALGLVNRVVEPGGALMHGLAYAQRIASFSPEVVRSIKALLQAGLTQPYETALQTERALFPALWAAEAHLQAVEAFLKRKPKN